MCNSYKTITKESKGLYKEKGSKFIAFANPVSTEEEIKQIYSGLKKEHHSAKHHCYAYRLGAVGNIYKAYDDNEPGYTAGKPILGQIDSFELTNVLIVVVRYFGGTLLGKGGLINAYKLAAMDALHNATFVVMDIKDFYLIKCQYEELNKIMNILRENNVNVENQLFGENCELKFSIRKSLTKTILDKLKLINKLEINYLYTS